jgi:hypothetical protein
MAAFFIDSGLLKQFCFIYIGCPTNYQTRLFSNNSQTNEDIATKQTHTTDTLFFISHTTNALLFKSLCNILIGFGIIKEMPGLVGSGISCKFPYDTFNFYLLFREEWYRADIRSG